MCEETYIGQEACGCVKMAVKDNPAHARDVAKAIAKVVRWGGKISRIPTQQVKEMDWVCPQHKMKLSSTQRRALHKLEALPPGQWKSSYSLGESLATLNSLRKRGLVTRKEVGGFRAIYNPSVGIEFRLAQPGLKED